MLLMRKTKDLFQQSHIRMLRKLKGWTQAELAEHCGISATNISLLEYAKVEIGKRRAEQIAKALGVHPAVIMFPELERNEIKRWPDELSAVGGCISLMVPI
jgi:transcriptional regulator with XRE-family HTH domain